MRHVHWMTLKWPWTLQGQMYPIYVLLVPPNPNFPPFCTTTSRCVQVTGRFKPSARNDTKMTNPTRSQVPYPYITDITESQISVYFALRPAVFWVTRHFVNSAPNDPKMALNPARLNVPHICVTSVPNSTISVRFAIRPAVFEFAGQVMKSAPNDTKMT